VAFPWVIAGLSDERVIGDAIGRGVTVVMTLGETVRLRVQGSGLGDCDATLASVRWSSSNPAVAALSPMAADEASLTAVGPGEAVLSAHLAFSDSPSQVVSPQVSGSRIGLRDVSRIRVVAP
jgi:hypothetical protein